MRKRTILIPVLFGIVLVSSFSFAQYSAWDSFNYPVGTSIDTLMGDASNGWAGSWYKIAAHQLNAVAASDTGLSYGDLPYAVPYTGNHLESIPDTSGTEQRYGRHLDKTWPNVAGQTYWISFLMNVKNATDNSTWLGVKFYNGDNSEIAMLGKGHGLDKYTVGSGWHGSAGPEVSDVAWTVGPVWLVGKMVMKGAESSDNDSLYMWISPDPEGGEPDVSLANAAASSAWKSGFNIIRIEFGGNIGNGLSVSFDELRLGTSFEDVSSPLVSNEFTAKDLFNYPLSQNLTGQGTAGNGWAGDWHLDPGATVLDSMMTITDAGIAYDDLPFAYPHSGNIVMGSQDRRGNGDVRMERTLAQQWPNDSGTVYWFSVFMNVLDDSNNATWAGVKLADPGHSDAAIMFGKGHGQDFYTCGGGWHGGPGPEVSNVRWDVGPVWLLGQIFNLGANTPGPAYMWINPDPGAVPDTAIADAMTTSGARTISDVRLEYGGGIPYTVYFSDLKIGSSFNDVVVGIEERFKNFVATTYALSQNYPNPFNPTTKISYVLKNSGKVILNVYDILGREVAELVNEEQNAGVHEVQFNAANLPSGIYLYRLNSASGNITKKMVLLK